MGRLDRIARFWPLHLIALICVLVEVILAGADSGLWSVRFLRAMAFQLGAFRPDIAAGAPALYPGQFPAMFITHGFLHAGLLHLVFNMMALYALGAQIIALGGAWRFWIIYFFSMVCGGLGVMELAATNSQTVGASGAIFGLVGAAFVWRAMMLRGTGAARRVYLRTMVSFVLINLALTLVLIDVIAWQAHLAGALGGALAGLFLPPPGLRRR